MKILTERHVFFFALIIHDHTSLIMYILEYFTQKFVENNCAPHHVLICCTVLAEEKNLVLPVAATELQACREVRDTCARADN